VDLYRHSIHQETNKYVMEIKFHRGCMAVAGRLVLELVNNIAE